MFTITAEMVESALDVWYENEDWRDIFQDTIVNQRYDMYKTLTAALLAAGLSLDEIE